AVREKVLHQRGGLQVFRMIALQTFRERNHHRAVEKRIFTVAFLGPAPARIASDISVRRSDHDTALVILRTLKHVASFVAFDLSCLFQQLRVPRFTESDSLLKRRGRNGQRTSPLSWTALSESMNAFDVTTRFDTQTRNARVRVETFNLLVHRHQRKDVVEALFDWEIRVLEWI